MMSEEVKNKLEEYREKFDEELTRTYTRIMSDKKIIETVNECIEKNVVYSDLLRMKYGEDINI